MTTRGYAAHVTPQVLAFRVLLESPDGTAHLGKIFAEGKLGGRRYGLCGLYFLAPSGFATTLRQIRQLELLRAQARLRATLLPLPSISVSRSCTLVCACPWGHTRRGACTEYPALSLRQRGSRLSRGFFTASARRLLNRSESFLEPRRRPQRYRDRCDFAPSLYRGAHMSKSQGALNVEMRLAELSTGEFQLQPVPLKLPLSALDDPPSKVNVAAKFPLMDPP